MLNSAANGFSAINLETKMLGIFKQKQNAFGLDISDGSIKVMQLIAKGDSYKVQGYADHNIPSGIMVNDVMVNKPMMVKHIRAAVENLDSGRVNTDRVVVSVPESKAFVRVIQIPKMSEEQAAQAVPFEAEQYIPVPIDQTYLDWQIISEEADKMNVLVSASPKDYIDTLVGVLKEAGLRPIAFEVESAACARSLLSGDQKGKSNLIMDMDKFRSSLILTENGSLQFTSSVPIAGDALTTAIAKALQVPAEQAEKIKREIGIDPQPENANVFSALAPVIENLIAETRNIIKFHDEHSQLPLNRIILSGGTAKLLYIHNYIYEKLGAEKKIPVVLGDPWINVFADKNQIPLDHKDSLSFTTAIGLALLGAQK